MQAEHRLGGTEKQGWITMHRVRGHAAVVGGESVHACTPCMTLVYMQRRVETVIIA